MQVRLERSFRALLSTNHVAVVSLAPSGKQGMINWKNYRTIRSLQIVDALCDIPHRWTIYIAGLCVDEVGCEYLKSVEVAPEGIYLAIHLTDVIQRFLTEICDSCNPKHMVANGWIAIPASVSLEEDQAAKIFEAAGAWNQVKVA